MEMARVSPDHRQLVSLAFEVALFALGSRLALLQNAAVVALDPERRKVLTDLLDRLARLATQDGQLFVLGAAAT